MNEPIVVQASVIPALEASRSFEDFYDGESRMLFRRLWLVTGNRAEAEELMQEAFLRVWERWDRVGRMDDPVGYLYRTAMNLFRNQYRRARVALSRAVGVGPEQDVFKPVEDRDAAARALGALRPGSAPLWC